MLEPEMTVHAESVSTPSDKALIIVPPLLGEGREFPTPAEEKELKIFRLDRDSTFAADLILALQNAVGTEDRCFRFARAPKDADINQAVIAAQVMPRSSFKGVPVEKAPEKTPEKTPEKASEKAVDAKKQ